MTPKKFMARLILTTLACAFVAGMALANCQSTGVPYFVALLSVVGFFVLIIGGVALLVWCVNNS